jgi:hypothetical protein
MEQVGKRVRKVRVDCNAQGRMSARQEVNLERVVARLD